MFYEVLKMLRQNLLKADFFKGFPSIFISEETYLFIPQHTKDIS